jgi:hypothetical protein
MDRTNKDEVAFYIRLAPFERQLILSMTERFHKIETTTTHAPEGTDNLQRRLFEKFFWTDKAIGFITEPADCNKDEPMSELHNERAFKEALHWLAHISFGEGGSRLFRTVYLREDNPEFVARLRDSEFNVLSTSFLPHPEDATYWEQLASLTLDALSEMKIWAGLEEPDRSKIYEIWKLLRKYSILRRRPNNDAAIDNFVLSQEFLSEYIIGSNNLGVGVRPRMNLKFARKEKVCLPLSV